MKLIFSSRKARVLSVYKISYIHLIKIEVENDKALYNNLTNTVRSANILMDDLRTNPKRYVSLSVFGKKDKSGALQAPIEQTKP